MVDDMVRDQDVLVVDRHVPFNGIPLQVAEVAIGDPGAIHLVMKSLTQDRIISFGHLQVIDQQITHHPRLFTANVDLSHRAITAHAQPGDRAV